MHKSHLLLAIKWIGIIWMGSMGILHAEENSYGPVKSGEMLWKIAGKVRPDASVTREQVVLALLKINPLAFNAPCNFNSLKIGSKLKIPLLSDIRTFDAKEAKVQVSQQSKAWKNRSKKPIECSLPEEPSTPATPATKETTLTSSHSESSPGVVQTTPPKEKLPSPAPTPQDPPSSAKTQLPPMTNPSTPPVVPPPGAMASHSPPATPPPVASEKPVALVADHEEPPKETPPMATTHTEEIPPTGGGQQSFMLIILAGGGLLAAFIIGWLLRKHIKTCAEETVDTKESPTEVNDQMPLHTDKKGHQAA